MQFNQRKSIGAATLSLLFAGGSVVAQEQSAGGDISAVFYGGLTFGGEDFLEVQYEYTDGSEGDDDLEAGGLIVFGAGISYLSYQLPVEYRATIGYHWDSVDADNGDASFDRMPVDLLVFYASGNHRIGGGLTYHLNPSYEQDIDGSYYYGGYDVSDFEIEFEDELGFVIEYNYMASDNFAIGLRYTLIEYTAETVDIDGLPRLAASEDVDGDHAGIMVNFLF